ncbi:glycosyltransferase [Candidatus Woesearchaeota archaeon]|nr:glycosyltransferase [Candidatus Woesearchaeota archaeon]
MRIAVFTDSYLPYVSGVTTAIVNQTYELAKKGHKIIIFCPTYKRLDKVNSYHSNISVVGLPATFEFPFYKGMDLAFPTALKSIRILKTFEPEIIHAQTEGGVGWEGLICAKVLNLPVVSTFHTFFGNPEYLKNAKLEKVKLAQRIVWNYSMLFHNRSDLVLTPSRAAAKDLRVHKLKKRPKVLSNGIKLPKTKDTTELKKFKRKYGLDSNLNLICVGRVSVEKGLDIALKAFKIVLIEYPDTKFIIIGDGPYMGEFRRTIKKLKLQNNVILAGKISNEIIIEKNVMRAGDIFVTASKSETQGVCIMEAMSFGMPIVAVNAKAVPELVKHNKNGFLTEPDDYFDMAKFIIMIIKNKRLRQRLGQNSLKLIQTHSIRKTSSELADIYETLIKKHQMKNTRIKKIKLNYEKFKKNLDKQLQRDKLEERFLELREKYRKLIKEKIKPKLKLRKR